jgi:hypothetical protein
MPFLYSNNLLVELYHQQAIQLYRVGKAVKVPVISIIALSRTFWLRRTEVIRKVCVKLGPPAGPVGLPR